MVLGLGVGGCTQASDPETGAASDERLAALSDRIDELEDQIADLGGRVADLEDAAPDGTEAPGEDGSATAGPTDGSAEGLFGDGEAVVGEQVTFRARVADVIPTTSLGSAFRIADRSGEPVPVLSATPSEGLSPDDVVEVGGTVVRVDRNTFEEDFGIDADQLLPNASGFFARSEGRLAVSATDVSIVEEPGG